MASERLHPAAYCGVCGVPYSLLDVQAYTGETIRDPRTQIAIVCATCGRMPLDDDEALYFELIAQLKQHHGRILTDIGPWKASRDQRDATDKETPEGQDDGP